MKKPIKGKTPSEILDIIFLYKEVVSMPMDSFVIFMQNIPQDKDFTFVMKYFRGQILIGSE